ncbi:stalk domain-containing protein [Bacillus taeanensis]|uniref:Uncharacterized protein n=1 Tax=Bacillus taeanensis TaxID=273032 RepID=A0A366XZ83_9BACI|nr:stalk domain-containing protein [Bacillus taeanensis]RBW69241.1 hypothetical protein DS031_12750 [Bacillus taeanensis]
MLENRGTIRFPISFALFFAVIFTVMVYHPAQSKAAANIAVLLNGKEIKSATALTLIKNDRTYVPIRFLSEEIGAEVKWDSLNRKVSISFKDNRHIELWIDSIQYEVNGERRMMDVTPFIKEGRTMVPLRFAAEGMGLNVRWDNVIRTVILDEVGLHTVITNDTLYRLSQFYNTTVDELIRLNNLNSTNIYLGQVLKVPAAQKITGPVNITSSLSDSELEWLAKIITAEARGESMQGQVAVGAVIMNRVSSSEFPNTVEEVVLQQNNGHYQFTPVASGAIYSINPTSENIEAAIRAANGEDPTNGSLFFYNPSIITSDWIKSRTVSTIIGNHVFAF